MNQFLLNLGPLRRGVLNPNPAALAEVKRIACIALILCLCACTSSPSKNAQASEPPSQTSNKTSELTQQATSASEDTKNSNSKNNQEAAELGPYEKIPPGPSVIVGSAPGQTGASANTEGEGVVSSVITYDNYNDPLIWINRPIFKFNDVTYRYVLTPLSRGYQYVVPDPVDKSIGNFFHNIREPLYSLNNLLQGKFAKSGKSLARFAINSTVGLLGFFDPADAWWSIDRKQTNFGDTLANYGVGYGTYLVLPILGPSDLRDTTSLGFEYFAHPLNNINDKQTGRVLLVTDGFQSLVPTLADYPKVVDAADDPYIFVRNLYLQGVQRDAQALRGEFDKSTPKTEAEGTPADKKPAPKTIEDKKSQGGAP